MKMTVEIVKEIIKMFLQNERQAYEIIATYKDTLVSDKAKDYIEGIKSLERHIDLYDNDIKYLLEAIKEEKKTKKGN